MNWREIIKPGKVNLKTPTQYPQNTQNSINDHQFEDYEYIDQGFLKFKFKDQQPTVKKRQYLSKGTNIKKFPTKTPTQYPQNTQNGSSISDDTEALTFPETHGVASLDDQGRLCVEGLLNHGTMLDTLIRLNAPNKEIELHIHPIGTPDQWQRWQEIKQQRGETNE